MRKANDTGDRPFDGRGFLAKTIQWSHLEGYLKDKPT